MSVLAGVAAATASRRSLFVAGGTVGSPVSLSAAVADTSYTKFILGDGYFNSATITRAGITIRAQNQHQAILSANMTISANNVTIDGLARTATSGTPISIDNPGAKILNCLVTGFAKTVYQIGIWAHVSALNVTNPLLISGNTINDWGGVFDSAGITIGQQGDNYFVTSSPSVTIIGNSVTGGSTSANNRNSAIQFFHPARCYNNYIDQCEGPAIQNKGFNCHIACNEISHCSQNSSDFPALYNRKFGGNLWEKNYVHDCFKGYEHYSGVGNTFRNNVVYNTSYWGQINDDPNENPSETPNPATDPSTDSLLIENNTFYNATNSPACYWNTGNTGIVQGVLWRKNIFYGDNTTTTIQVESDPNVSWDEDDNMFYLCTAPTGTTGAGGSSDSGINPNFVGGSPFNFTAQAAEASGRGAAWPRSCPVAI